MVIELAVCIQIKRIHGEVTARGILDPIPAKRNLGVAAIRFHIGPKAGHLIRLAILHQCEGTMLQSRWNNFETSLTPALHGLARQGSRRAVNISDWQTKQRVAHRATHDAHLITISVQRGKKRFQACIFSPGKISFLADIKNGCHCCLNSYRWYCYHSGHQKMLPDPDLYPAQHL